ncbi:phosphate ABC transporter permease PstA [Puia sp.]|jgi:phosphate transport system permease protein|uniref:phosphate ABC transporter permease PstA n=1 Tax=Puia sp. TaxID=2045100 RepID=UPI002F422A18
MDGKNVKLRLGKSYGFQWLIYVLAFACLVPLLAILFYIVRAGITKINWHFLVNIPKPVGESGGGIANALVGSTLIIFVAAVIAIPIGIMAGVYLSENRKSRLAYWCRLCTDILQGVPSIVVGIVAYFWLVRPWDIGPIHHKGGFSALSGSAALAIMMLPIIIRSTEETLKLLPDSLKEAALALGMPFHRVIFKVVVPVGISGILSGVMLSVARITGETAPLLFTAFGNPYLSVNIGKPMQSLPLMIFNYATSPYTDWLNLAWGASLILLVWVLLLNIFTKVITRKWKVQL